MRYECSCPLQDYINFIFKASGIIGADVDNFLERIEPAGAGIRDPAAAVRNSDVAPPRDHSDMRAIAPPTNGSPGQPLRRQAQDPGQHRGAAGHREDPLAPAAHRPRAVPVAAAAGGYGRRQCKRACFELPGEGRSTNRLPHLGGRLNFLSARVSSPPHTKVPNYGAGVTTTPTGEMLSPPPV